MVGGRTGGNKGVPGNAKITLTQESDKGEL